MTIFIEGQALVPFDTHWEVVQELDKLKLNFDILQARHDRLQYIVARDSDPGELNDEEAELARECHRIVFPQNYPAANPTQN